MNSYLRSSISALAMSAMIMTGVVVATLSITVIPAYSKSDNANSRSSNGRENRNNGNNGNGSSAMTSSLGALNAAHANARALENASTNSRLGMIALYKAAVMASAEVDMAVENANSALALFEASCDPDGDVEFDNLLLTPEQCGDLLELATVEKQELADADLGEVSGPVTPVTYEDYLTILEAELEAIIAEAIGLGEFEDEDEDEDEALLLAANKETNDDVIEALWDMLDIDGFERTEP